MGEKGSSLEDDDPLCASEEEVWRKLCVSDPALTAAGASAALALALDDMEGGAGKLSEAMIRSAIGYLDRRAE